MKLLNFIFIMCLVIFPVRPIFAGGPPAIPTDTNAPKAIVTPTASYFWFPVQKANETWTWGISGRDALEYSWAVKVATETARYQLGYTIFVYQQGKRTGTFSDLVKSGQADLWQYDPEEGSNSAIEGMRGIHIRVKDGGLLIELTNEEWIKRLFGAKPQFVEFESSGFLQDHVTLKVPIKY